MDDIPPLHWCMASGREGRVPGGRADERKGVLANALSVSFLAVTVVVVVVEAVAQSQTVSI